MLIREEILELETKQKAFYDSVNKLAAISIRENKDEWNAQANEARILFNQMFDPDNKEEQEEEDQSLEDHGDDISQADIESLIGDAHDKSLTQIKAKQFSCLGRLVTS